MTRIRRVGSLTLGVCLLLFGSLFLLKLFVPSISYQFLLTLWPLILIILGLEVIIAYIIKKDENLKYDGTAFFLIIALTVFTMGMACFDFLLQHADEVVRIVR